MLLIFSGAGIAAVAGPAFQANAFQNNAFQVEIGVVSGPWIVTPSDAAVGGVTGSDAARGGVAASDSAVGNVTGGDA